MIIHVSTRAKVILLYSQRYGGTISGVNRLNRIEIYDYALKKTLRVEGIGRNSHVVPHDYSKTLKQCND